MHSEPQKVVLAAQSTKCASTMKTKNNKQSKALVTGITNFCTVVILISKLHSLEQVMSTENAASMAALTNILLTAFHLYIFITVWCAALSQVRGYGSHVRAE